jgi:hypothetical protein
MLKQKVLQRSYLPKRIQCSLKKYIINFCQPIHILTTPFENEKLKYNQFIFPGIGDYWRVWSWQDREHQAVDAVSGRCQQVLFKSGKKLKYFCH